MAVLYIFTIIFTCFYLYIKWCQTYWKRVGMPFLKPRFLVGNITFKNRVSPGIFLSNFYKIFKDRGWKYGGFYIFNQPIWIPTDIELIKSILTKDFSHFMNHNTSVDENVHDLGQINLFNLTDDRWRKLRLKLTPTFTSGKLKMMFPTLLQTTYSLNKILENHAIIQDAIDVKDLVARFTTDGIGSCAFGIDCNSLQNPSSEFRKYGDAIFQRRGFNKVFQYFPPQILLKFGIKLLDQDVEDFFSNIVKNTIDYREKNNIYRRDFMHLLIQLKNTGVVSEDDELLVKRENSESGSFLSMEEIIAQCILFFFGGFETSATAMTFALLEMALNPDIQEKLRTKIEEISKKYNGQITYESVSEMKYLDMVVYETLRKYPPIPATARNCNKDYRIPDSDIVIEKNTTLNIPVYGIHHDPDYYPDPEKFDPERFSDENKAKRTPYTFLAFGEGPRICIGARFGLMQMKLGLITIIKNFKITLNTKTKIPVTFKKEAFFLTVDGGVWINVGKT